MIFHFGSLPIRITSCPFMYIHSSTFLGKAIVGRNSMYLFFSTFRQSLFARNQSFSFSNSWFIVLYNLGISGDDKVTVVSSAKLRTLIFVELLRSLTYIKKRIGPRIEPCGTPQVMFTSGDLVSYHSMYCLRSVK